jgi:hypothetical protein
MRQVFRNKKQLQQPFASTVIISVWCVCGVCGWCGWYAWPHGRYARVQSGAPTGSLPAKPIEKGAITTLEKYPPCVHATLQ